MKKLVIILAALLVFGIPSALFAGEWEIGLEWDPNTETNLAGYGAYWSDTAGGPYTKFGEVPAGMVEIWYTFNAPDGQLTTRYFVVDAFNTEGLRSAKSNEVHWDYDFLLIVAATEFAAVRDADNITFSWKQADIGRVKKWKIFSKEAATEFTELAEIEYTGQAGPQYSTTEKIVVPVGEIKTFTFAIVTYTEHKVFSPNSNEITITIDMRPVAPVYNLKIKVRTD